MEYARISDALHDLVFSQRLTVDQAMDKYFADGYRHRHSGAVRSRAEFAEKAAAARARIARGTVTVLDEFRDGRGYAERHLLTVVRNDGSAERTEVYVIGRYADDGRFASLNEAGFPVAEAGPSGRDQAETAG
jgi:hypothetical protein